MTNQSLISLSSKHSSTLTTMVPNRAEIETTRPFRSVKEAIAVFGERLLSGEAYAPTISSKSKPELPSKPVYAAFSPPPSFSSTSSQFNQDKEEEELIMSSLKRLEAELQEIRRELMLLKDREAETEITVASLNAELHNSMSKLSEIEAMGEAKVAKSYNGNAGKEAVPGDLWREKKAMEFGMSSEYLPALAQALNLGMHEGEYDGKRKKVILKKQKPIVPLIGDIFFKKKASNDKDSSLY